ncbi:MAG: DUF169 domain-containing protein [Dehalococcoidales bacterium]|nr:DUF169 domain-containing protein [Dehalococcoidales bacterium]
MTSLLHDYSVLNGFDFQYKPVGIKFLLNKPEDLPQTGNCMPICRLFAEAQKSDPFYASKENFSCVDRLLMGMIEPEPTTISGQIGAKEKIYQEARANRRIYQYAPRLQPNTVRHVAFSSVDKMTFEPDVMLFTARPDQAEIILRALSYSTGKPLTTKITPVLMCAWVFIYPYVTGETNYVVTGIGYGFRMQKVLPEGLFVISVPYDMIPMLLENLRHMDWVLPANKLSEQERKEYSARIIAEIQSEYLNG